jgi:calnexin
VQYEVKLQHGLECGGAYIKLLTEEEESESAGGEDEQESGKGLRAGEEYTDKTPFTIMFGPDKCGSTNKGELWHRLLLFFFGWKGGWE